MNGHTLTCTGDLLIYHTGILLVGVGAAVKNGVIEDCEEGVVVGEEGGGGLHAVSGLEVMGAGIDTGITVNTNNNLIVGNYVHDNESDGILVNGNSNVIKENTVNSNFNNEFEGNGIHIVGDKNSVTMNTANDNEDDGIDVDGDKNLITGNKTKDNGDGGIDVSGHLNGINLNKSFGNGDFDMEDDNGDCVHNFWMFNFFGTKDPACIS